MTELRHASKRYGDVLAVDDVSFTIQLGRVTGFLGPNGAGTSTTMRMIVGLDAPGDGSVFVDGGNDRDRPAPLPEVGAMLEARAVHTGRTAVNHLLAIAQTHGSSGRALTAEHLVIVGRGRVLADTTVDDVVARACR